MNRIKVNVFISSIAFVLGFSLVFTLLGASATAAGKFLFHYKILFARIAGAVVILLGLHLTGILRIPFLYQEKRIQISQKPPGLAGAFILGLAFAFGWTPCIGPFLGAVLALAADKATVGSGILLLLAFSLGLGIPFLLAAAAIDYFFSAFQKIKHYFHWIEVIGGILLVVIGIFLITGSFTRLAGLASALPEIATGPSGDNLSILSAFIAGFLAFLSPCVLPLIPGYLSYMSGLTMQELRASASN